MSRGGRRPAPRHLAWLALLALLAGGAAAAEDLVVRGDVVHTMGPAGTLRPGVVVIRSGRVVAAGAEGEVAPPAGARELRAAVVTPGLIDAHSVAGLAGMYNVAADQDADETTGWNQAALRAIDGFHPREPLLDWLVRHGVTAVQSGPGQANVIGGLAGVFRTHGESVEDMTLRFPSALVVHLGEPPKTTYLASQGAPMTRMGTAALLRQALVEAQEYARKRGEPAAPDGVFGRGLFGGREDEGPPPARDLAKEALLLALSGDVPTLVTARREDDIRTALRIAREFSLDLHLAGATDGYLMARELWEAGVPVHVGPVMERLGPIESLHSSFEAAALLSDAGVPITFQSGFESYVPKLRVVLFEAGIAAAYGLPPERALAALTADAARILGVADRIGSLEPGKDADLALWSGDPFEYTTHAEVVLSRGRIAFERE